MNVKPCTTHETLQIWPGFLKGQLKCVIFVRVTYDISKNRKDMNGRTLGNKHLKSVCRKRQVYVDNATKGYGRVVSCSVNGSFKFTITLSVIGKGNILQRDSRNCRNFTERLRTTTFQSLQNWCFEIISAAARKTKNCVSAVLRFFPPFLHDSHKAQFFPITA